MVIDENKEIKHELVKIGVNDELIAKTLKDALTEETVKIDKNGEVHPFVDYGVRLKAIELYIKLMGLKAPNNLHLHQHLNGVEIDDLDRKAKENRSSEKRSK